MTNNVGAVIYEKNFETGGLNAVWNYFIDGQVVTGTGIAQGEAGNQMTGNYTITYYTNGTPETTSFELVISQKEDQILLEWYNKEVLSYFGIGIIKDNILTGGWSKYTDEHIK
jgi:hypothetical protein